MAEVEMEDMVSGNVDDGYAKEALLGPGVHGELKEKVQTLRAPPNSPPGGLSLSWDGDVWVSQDSRSDWAKKRLWVEGDGFHLSKKNTKPEKFEKKLSYTFTRLISKPDKVAQDQKDSGVEVNSKRMMLFTEHETIVIAFASENDHDQFYNRSQEMLQQKYSANELSEKKQASDDLAPLITEQRRVQRELGDYIAHELSHSGLPALSQNDMSRTVKQGKLFMKKNGKYVSYHFMITVSSLRYFHPRSEVPNHHKSYERKLAGVIPLLFMSGIDSYPSKKNKKFTVSTPLRQYYFKAEHEVAKDLWVEGLINARASYRKKHKNRKAGGGKGGEAEPLSERDRGASFMVDGNANEDSSDGEACQEMGNKKDQPSDGDYWDPNLVPHLSYVNSKGKERKAVVKPDSNFTVGRSRTCSWIIDGDHRISREHAKFYFNRAQNTLIFYDLGSRRGCRYNGAKVIKTFLKPGDTIQVGDTDIQVAAGQPHTGGFFHNLFSGSGKKEGFEKMD